LWDTGKTAVLLRGAVVSIGTQAHGWSEVKLCIHHASGNAANAWHRLLDGFASMDMEAGVLQLAVVTAQWRMA